MTFRSLITVCIVSNLGLLLAMKCTFEKKCLWDLNGGVGFNIRKARFSRDGPKQDFSRGNRDGQYAIVTSKKRRASMQSPWFGDTIPKCKLQFYAHITPGNNSISVRKDDGETLWTLKPKFNTARWREYNITIGQMTEPFRLIIEASRDRKKGYVAIDQIKMVDCDPDLTRDEMCSLEEFYCNTTGCIHHSRVCDINMDCVYGEDEANCDYLPVHSRCTFDKDWCGWHNIGRKGTNWSRSNGDHFLNDPKDRLTGPANDHTMKNKTGYFLHFDASTEQQMLEGKVVESETFDPPPQIVYDQNSPYYNTCRVQFYYHMFGPHTQTLELVVNSKQFNIPKVIMEKSHKNEDRWRRESIPLPKLTERYSLRFIATKGYRYLGDIAVDDFSLTPECFLRVPSMVTAGPAIHYKDDENRTAEYEINTCGSQGNIGPTPLQCKSVYKYTNVNITVQTTPPFEGMQVWVVPETAKYSITALGASGGNGLKQQDMKLRRGAFAHAEFNFTEGEILYILVGQEGQTPCSQTSMLNRGICGGHEEYDSAVPGGGGGGGGGSFVFKMVDGELELLIVAAGGGGLAYRKGNKFGKESKKYNKGTNAATFEFGPGGGGGFNGTAVYPQAGSSLLEGGAGGINCPDVPQVMWAYGGFGGGGGGCTAGGGGGGFSGGPVSSTNDLERNGEGGKSYVHPSGNDVHIVHGANTEISGVVEIVVVDLMCHCEHLCQKQNGKYKCICRNNYIVAEDGSCQNASSLLMSRSVEMESISDTGMMIAIVVGSLVTLISISTCLVCIIKWVQRNNKKRIKAARLELLVGVNTDNQLNSLRPNAHLETNPNYDFCGDKCSFQDLREIPRDKLTLVKALGQGAFGEVYQGYLSDIPREPSDLPVAVKTLPALCTDQAEMDFLMEAVIMSKFQHKNIVRFIGVCFEKHPRFIILELLEGNDMKTFLRESRPKLDRPSPLSMPDLIKMSLDVSYGCQYLEANHFIHRDIAARNCLLTTKGPYRVAKIADFGMARDIYRADYYRKGGKAMLPVKWMPPEAFLDGIFTSKTDVWSFGILLWEVFTLGYMPYPGRGNQEVMQFVTNGGRLEAPDNCPAPIYGIMTDCWKSVAELRSNFTQIIERLGYCSQDPDVTSAALPIFFRPPSIEKDQTLMRPKDPDSHVLRVEANPTNKPHVSSNMESIEQILSCNNNESLLDCSRGLKTNQETPANNTENDLLLPQSYENSPRRKVTRKSNSPNASTGREHVPFRITNGDTSFVNRNLGGLNQSQVLTQNPIFNKSMSKLDPPVLTALSPEKKHHGRRNNFSNSNGFTPPSVEINTDDSGVDIS
ncbi:unnamed protein product [Owenia fusiformis]|uniref:Tyrosine-protein kinase receptor n=1 Tax=Owenia fusiformis TaxID=6347 RepID=A0A8S4PHM9_OWEFU|nr:unnamed protein product [Owenia fusiformis]